MSADQNGSKNSLCPYKYPELMEKTGEFDSLARWTALRDLGGHFDAEEMIGTVHSDEDKLTQLKTHGALAEYLGISQECVSRWKKEYHEDLGRRVLWYADKWLGDQAPVVFHNWIKGIKEKQTPELIKLFIKYKLGYREKQDVAITGDINITYETVSRKEIKKPTEEVNSD